MKYTVLMAAALLVVTLPAMAETTEMPMDSHDDMMGHAAVADDGMMSGDMMAVSTTMETTSTTEVSTTTMTTDEMPHADDAHAVEEHKAH